MTKDRPIELIFNAKQQVARLKIVAGLHATNELSDAAIKVVVRNVQAAAGPRSAEIRAHIKTRPVVWRDGNGAGQRFCRHVSCMSDESHSDCCGRSAY